MRGEKKIIECTAHYRASPSRCEPGTDRDPKELEFRGKINHRSTIREAQMIGKEVQNKRLFYTGRQGGVS